MKQKGFTLIEILIVIGIMGVVGVILVNTVFSVLRGSNKGEIANEIRSEGNHAMESIVRSLQSAPGFKGVSSDFNSYTTPCPASSSPAYKSVQVSESSFVSCPNGSAMNSFSSINRELVQVSSCAIYCTQSNVNDRPNFTVSFSLSQSNNYKGGGKFFENKASIDFSTTVRMRNLVE